MAQNNKMIKVFTGTEVVSNLIKEELEHQGIISIVKNDFYSGVQAGFVGGTPSAIDIYVEGKDVEKATPIIEELVNN